MALMDSNRHAFWSADCPQRGSSLSHVQNGAWDAPCAECGQAPVATDPEVKRRLAELGSPPDRPITEYATHAFLPTITGVCNRCKKSQAEGAHTVTVATPAILEPGLTTGTYRQWQRAVKGGYEYADGNPNGPGRGELSERWVEWATKHPWKRDGA